VFRQLHRYWQIFWQFRRLRFMAMLEYRADFFFWSFISIMWTVFNFFFFDLILGATGMIGGWTRPEIYVLLSTFSILDAFTWSFFYANMNDYTDSVFSGELSMYLTKPIDAQYLLSIKENSYNNVFRFVIGIGILIWSVGQLPYKLTPLHWLGYLGLLSISLLFIYSLWFLIATLSFWVDKLNNLNEVVPQSRRMWQVPRSIYTGLASVLFTVIVPLGLVSSIPSEILVQKLEYNWTLFFIGITIFLFGLGRWFFQVSIKKYSSVGN
jgi:ABC-2 type transport system permease protein